MASLHNFSKNTTILDVAEIPDFSMNALSFETYELKKPNMNEIVKKVEVVSVNSLRKKPIS